MPAVINHYKTLGLPNFASLGEVRKSYLKKIRLYHPDINKTKEAEEISKNLNVAKEALENANKKATYDGRLRRYIQNPSAPTYTTRTTATRKTSRQMTRQERSRRNMARKKVNNTKEYEKWLKKYPMPLRYMLFSIVGIFFLCVFYTVVFRGTPGEWLIMSMLVLTLYYNVVKWATTDYSKYISYMVHRHGAKIDLDKATSKFFNYSFFGGCVAVMALKFLIQNAL